MFSDSACAHTRRGHCGLRNRVVETKIRFLGTQEARSVVLVRGEVRLRNTRNVIPRQPKYLARAVLDSAR